MAEHINLIPEEIKKKRKERERRPFVVVILVLYFFALGIIYFYQAGGVKEKLNVVENMVKERDAMVAQNAAYKEVMRRIAITQEREGEIKRRLDVISVLLEDRIRWSDILRNMSHLVKDIVWFSSLSTYDLPGGPGKGMKFNGTAVSNSEISEFVFALENSPFFRNVLLVYSQKREFQGRDLYDFEITADLRKIDSFKSMH